MIARRPPSLLPQHIDRGRLVSDLRPDDFRQLQDALRKQRRKGKGKSLVVLGNWIARIRQVFRFGDKNGHIEREPNYGTEFDRPRGVKVERQKQAKVEEHGQRTFAADEIRCMLGLSPWRHRCERPA